SRGNLTSGATTASRSDFKWCLAGLWCVARTWLTSLTNRRRIEFPARATDLGFDDPELSEVRLALADAGRSCSVAAGRGARASARAAVPRRVAGGSGSAVRSDALGSLRRQLSRWFGKNRRMGRLLVVLPGEGFLLRSVLLARRAGHAIVVGSSGDRRIVGWCRHHVRVNSFPVGHAGQCRRQHEYSDAARALYRR